MALPPGRLYPHMRWSIFNKTTSPNEDGVPTKTITVKEVEFDSMTGIDITSSCTKTRRRLPKGFRCDRNDLLTVARKNPKRLKDAILTFIQTWTGHFPDTPDLPVLQIAFGHYPYATPLELATDPDIRSFLISNGHPTTIIVTPSKKTSGESSFELFDTPLKNNSFGLVPFTRTIA